MRDFPASSPAVVVGIDGSPTAVDAALWAVDEAVSRDIPLRLVYAIDPDNTSGTDPQDAARDLAAAEVAVRYAYTAVESTDKPVKIEVEILQASDRRAHFLRPRDRPPWRASARWTFATAPTGVSGRPQRRWRRRRTVRWLSFAAGTRIRPDNAGWWPRSTNLRRATASYGAPLKRRGFAKRRFAC